MAMKGRIFDAESDTEGHGARAFRREVEVEEIKLRTSDGDELTLEPVDDGESLKVTDGPDDLKGHMMRISDERAKDEVEPLDEDAEGHGRKLAGRKDDENTGEDDAEGARDDESGDDTEGHKYRR